MYTTMNSDSMAQVLMHESTHKAIKIIYGGNFPYNGDDENSSSLIKGAIDDELERTKYQRFFVNSGDNWLQKMVMSYEKEDHTAEILPWLIDQVTLNIFHGNKGTVSQKFIEVIWKYLQDALINYESVVSVEGEAEQVPDLTSLIDIPEVSREIVQFAQELISSEPINIKWFDSEHGKLAFQIATSYAQEEFINDLFKHLINRN